MIAALGVVLSSPLACVGGIALIAGGGGGAPPLTPSALASAGLPERAAVAYQNAGAQCPGLDWTLLASVGAIETRHGQHGAATPDPATGEVRPWIFGPDLDGRNGTAAIPIGPWIDWWGLTGPWTRAVGPMQFLPATFTAHAVDADGDGITSPHDLDDAAMTAAAYLCAAGGGSIDGPAEVARIYNSGDPTYADNLAREQERIETSARSAPELSGTGTASACPVDGEIDFSDTFGAPRSGGRTHQGVDIFAPVGTPVVAPASGRVEHFDNSLGGLSYRLIADDGTFYYGTHLSGYENVGVGQVTAGTVIGYVGNTGNAATTPPHLHWEIHPDGRGTPAINPTPAASSLCPQ